jgi:hypothetical protein
LINPLTHCFSIKFNIKEKFSLKLKDIYKLVPGYKKKLKLNINKIFNKLKVKKIVKRFNIGY